jgi:hypothetical protein
MRTLNFKRYEFANGDNRPTIELWARGFRSIPADLEREGLMQQLLQLGFDDIVSHPENVGVGFLTAPWQGHPKLAMVVGKTMNFSDGEVIAVSQEKAPPSPLGEFDDDPTLEEICQEAYRQRRNGASK